MAESNVSDERRDPGGEALLPLDHARLEAGALVSQLPVLDPTQEVLSTALRGSTTLGWSWFDS